MPTVSTAGRPTSVSCRHRRHDDARSRGARHPVVAELPGSGGGDASAGTRRAGVAVVGAGDRRRTRARCRRSRTSTSTRAARPRWPPRLGPDWATGRQFALQLRPVDRNVWTDVCQRRAGNVYFLYGSDPHAHRLIAGEYPWDGTQQHVLTYDTTTGTRSRKSRSMPPPYNIFAGRVDPQRHRAALLARRGGDQADVVLPVDTTTGAGNAGRRRQRHAGREFYTMLDVEQASGKVDLGGSFAGDLCVIRRSGFTTVDLDPGTAAPMSATNRCLTGIVSDQAGHADVTVGPFYSYPMLPAARMQQVDETTGTVGDLQALGARSPIFPTVDTVHGLLVVGFLGGTDWQTNNNGMSGVGVYDLHTGAQVSLDERFDLLPTAFNSYPADVGVITNERGIQLDPATRTAWTYGPGNTQVQQFSY